MFDCLLRKDRKKKVRKVELKFGETENTCMDTALGSSR